MERYTRREALLAGVTTSVALVGCLNEGDTGDGAPTEEPPVDGTPTRTDEGNGTPSEDGTPEDGGVDPAAVLWTYDVGGTVATVANGLLLAREGFDEGTGGIVALDASTGDRQWTYGETGGYSVYTLPAVGDDAIYTGYGDDAIGSGSGSVHAVGLDGTEQWTEETGSVYHTPRLDDGAVYVGDDAGAVRAFDAASGENRWSVEVTGEGEDVPPGDVTVEAVVDGRAYVAGDEGAWAVEEGEIAWSFPTDGRRVSSIRAGELVYCSPRGSVVALDDGEEGWSADGALQAVTDEAVYLRRASELCAFDPGSGDELWCVDINEDGDVAVADDGRVFYGTDEVTAVAADGESRWSVVPEGGAVQSLVVADAVYAVTRNAVTRIADGELDASVSAGGVRSLVVDGGVYAATNDAMYELAL